MHTDTVTDLADVIGEALRRLLGQRGVEEQVQVRVGVDILLYVYLGGEEKEVC